MEAENVHDEWVGEFFSIDVCTTRDKVMFFGQAIYNDPNRVANVLLNPFP
jgi:uncharacterized protein YegJ (DUF2314 family)